MGLFRLLLALSVVADHAGPAFRIPWLRMFGGSLAVQAFYVTSGFYMALILNEKYVGKGSYRTFLHSRLWRLLPMFWVTLATTLLAGFVIHATCGRDLEPFQPWREHAAGMPIFDWLVLVGMHATIVGQDVASFLAVDPTTHSLFFTTNYDREVLPAWRFLLIPQSWTVGVELMFYAVAPLLVRRGTALLMGLVVLSLLLRVGLMHGFALRHDPWTYRFFPTELALFLAGAIAYRAYAWLRQLGQLRVWNGTLALAVTVALVVTYRLWPAAGRAAPYGLPLVLALVPVLLPFVFGLTVRIARDRELGELSYPVYLVHYPLLFVVGALDVEWLTAHRGECVLLGSLLFAVLLWRGVGRPLEKSRQLLATRLKPAAA